MVQSQRLDKPLLRSEEAKRLSTPDCVTVNEMPSVPLHVHGDKVVLRIRAYKRAV